LSRGFLLFTQKAYFWTKLFSMPKSGKGSCIDGCKKFPKNTSRNSGMSLDFDKLRRRKKMKPSGDMDKTYTKPTPPTEQKEVPNVQVAYGSKVYGSAKQGSKEEEELYRQLEVDQGSEAVKILRSRQKK
jgi:hypothetical protein